MARLGDLCDILNGYAFKSEQYVGSGIRIIRIANVQKGYIEDSTPVFYPIDNNEYKKYFGKEIEYFYHTHDLMTYDGLPFIGSVDKNLFICTGFNKWGNTNGTLAGRIVSDLICSKKNRFSLLFNPKRGLSFDKIKNLFLFNI